MPVTDKMHNKLIFSIVGGGKIDISFYLWRKKKRFRYPLRYTSKESSRRINAPHGTKPLYMQKNILKSFSNNQKIIIFALSNNKQR